MSNNSPSNLFDAPTNVKILHQQPSQDWTVVDGGVIVWENHRLCVVASPELAPA